LKLVQVIGKLLKALLEGSELGGASGDAMAAGPKHLLLVEKSFEADFELPAPPSIWADKTVSLGKNPTHLGLFL